MRRNSVRPSRFRHRESSSDPIKTSLEPHAVNDMLLQVEPLIPALRRYARALVRNAATADDLVQDCLERAVSHWHQRREGNPRSWLFAILHNLAINQLRQARTRGQHVAIEETSESDLGEDAVQERKLMYQDVLKKLAKLPEEQFGVLPLDVDRRPLHELSRCTFEAGHVFVVGRAGYVVLDADRGLLVVWTNCSRTITAP